jgi:acetyltransferase-like isoleucine patch superfamily enzyme
MTWWLPETRFFGWKRVLLHWAGATIGKNVRINSSAVFSGNGDLSIGEDVWIGACSVIMPVAPARVAIGSHVDIGPGVMILTGSHEIDPDGLHIGGPGKAVSVTVEDGCWLGARATILPGATLAEKTLVAAGAVVTNSVGEPCSLVAGVPAVVKEQLVR